MDVGTPDHVITTDQSNREPEGVLQETDMKLLCSGKPLCVPITQVSTKASLFLSVQLTRNSTSVVTNLQKQRLLTEQYLFPCEFLFVCFYFLILLF